MTERDDARTPTPPAEPFARRQVTWGRPPSSVFHVGPLPKGPAVSPLVEPQPARPAPRTGSILSGSMVPTAARPRQPVVTTSEPEWIGEPAIVAPFEPAAPVETRPVVDTTVRPLPTPAPEAPAPVPAPLPEPAPVVRQTVDAEPAPVMAPSYARAGAKRSSRTPLYVGGAVVVLALVAGGVWFATRPGAPEAPVAAVAPAAPAPLAVEPPVTTVEEAPSAATPVVAPATPVPAAVQPVTANRPVAAGSTAVQTRPAPRAASPRTVQTPAATAPAPRPYAPPAITVQPLVVTPPPAPQPAPTAARSAPSDPDAPITTRPQPLD